MGTDLHPLSPLKSKSGCLSGRFTQESLVENGEELSGNHAMSAEGTQKIQESK